MLSWITNLFRKIFIGTPAVQPVAPRQTSVVLTVSTAHNKDAFQINVGSPAGDPKQVFADFESWYADTRGSEHYMLQSDTFKAVMCRRFIAGYTIVINK